VTRRLDSGTRVARVEVVLVRHGETEWSRTGRHTGRTDVPLTEEGERQARAVGAALRGREFALVLSSPLLRALDTARLAGFEPEVRDDLAEWDYGEYDGVTTPEIREQVPDWTIWRYGALGGESVEPIGSSRSYSGPRATCSRSRTATSCGCWPLAGSGSRPRRAGCSRSTRGSSARSASSVSSA